MIFCTRSTPMRKFFYYYYYFYYFIVNILWLSNMADNFFRNSRAAQIFVGLFFLDCAFRILIGWADKLRSHVWYIGQYWTNILVFELWYRNQCDIRISQPCDSSVTPSAWTGGGPGRIGVQTVLRGVRKRHDTWQTHQSTAVLFARESTAGRPARTGGLGAQDH